MVNSNPLTIKDLVDDSTRMVILSLRACGTSYDSISMRINLPLNDIKEICNGPSSYVEQEVVDNIKKGLANKLYLASSNIISCISDEDVEQATLQQKASSVATLIDKARLLSNESTENIAGIQQVILRDTDELSKLEQEQEKLRREISDLEISLAMERKRQSGD